MNKVQSNSAAGRKRSTQGSLGEQGERKPWLLSNTEPWSGSGSQGTEPGCCGLASRMDKVASVPWLCLLARKLHPIP